MVVLSAPRIDSDARVRPLLRREYDRLVDEGCFADDRLELLRGTLVEMSPQKPEHAEAVERLTMLFVRHFSERARVRIQLPFAASDDSEPEPDVAVVPRERPYGEHPSRAHLIVEVSLSSPVRDLELKSAIYAEAEVTEYWVLDLPNRCVHVHRNPAALGYGEVRVVRSGERLTLVAFPDVEIEIDTLVG